MYLLCNKLDAGPKTNNPIEAYFNQIKTYMKKNRNVENYEQ